MTYRPRQNAIETIIVPRARDLGNGFEVRRALPSAQCRMVEPFVFFDQMGPAVLRAGAGLDVRPQPHIGLATSLTCSMARSCTATASAASNRSGAGR